MNYGHVAVNKIISNLGLSYTYVQIIYAIILVLSLKYFIDGYQLDKFLAYCIFFPIGILLMGMGFVRQGVALSFLLISLVFLKNKKSFFAYFFIIIGCFFHKSLVIFIPLYLLIIKDFRILIIILSLFFLYVFFTHFFIMYSIYLGSERGTEYDPAKGAYLRIAQTLLPAIFCIFFYKYLNYTDELKKIILFFSYIVFVMIFFSLYAMTFIDRVVFYFIFLQLIIVSQIPYLFSGNLIILVKSFIVFLYLIILNVFLIFATHAKFWNPYKIVNMFL